MGERLININKTTSCLILKILAQGVAQKLALPILLVTYQLTYV